MIKFITSGLLLLGIAAFVAFTAVITAPYYYYHRAINNKYQGSWYKLSNYQNVFLHPKGKMPFELLEDSSSSQWKSFQFENVKVPVPVKNPFYIMVPILNYDKEQKLSHIGLKFNQPNGLTLARVVFLPRQGFSKDFREQKIFKLPLAANMLQVHDGNKLWEDIFTKDITDWNIAYDQMIYNLYILHKRSKLIHPNAYEFGILSNGLAKISLKTKDKDFSTELLYHYDHPTIYGILLQWRTESLDAQKLRSKLINDMRFEVSNPSLTDFIYKEFKQLGYKKQVTHEGLAYLLSAWSHQQNTEALIQAMVMYLERGTDNQAQLKPLYEYALARYGVTFSNEEVEDNLLEGQALLQQKIELESKKEQIERDRELQDLSSEPENLTPEQRLKIRIENAKKQRIKVKTDQMIMN